MTLHWGQRDSCLLFKRSWARRLPDRELECLRFGTAIEKNPRIRLPGRSFQESRILSGSGQPLNG